MYQMLTFSQSFGIIVGNYFYMARRTSIAAYNEIKESGLLAKRRLEVYDVLFHHGPLTAGELLQLMASRVSKGAASSSWKRLSELRDAGVIEETKERICQVTGMNVIEWDVTDQLPIKRIEKVSRKAMKKKLLEKIAGLGSTVDENLKRPLREIYLMAKEI
jgi:hypothetical protein